MQRIVKIALQFLSIILFALGLCISARAENGVSVSLLPSVRESSAITLQIQFKLNPGWHVYGVTPGEMGLPPTVHVSPPPSFEFKEALWPKDDEFVQGEFRCRGYSSDFVLRLPLKQSQNMIPTLNASAHVALTWLGCNGVTCVPEKKEVDILL